MPTIKVISGKKYRGTWALNLPPPPAWWDVFNLAVIEKIFEVVFFVR